MKQKINRIESYFSPEVKVAEMSLEGVLCSSGDEQKGVSINDMTIIQGGEGSGWDWE